jgi:hypothetical protein
MHTFDPLCVPSDLPGVNLATLNEILIYYRLMTKWSGLGDSTELSRVGLSQFLNKLRDPHNLRLENRGIYIWFRPQQARE